MTPLRGADGEVYAVSQGALSIGGFAVAGQSGVSQKNQLNTGRIPNGAIVEKEALGEVFRKDKFRLLLKEPDFNTSRLIARSINERNPDCAITQDAGAVICCVPQNRMVNPPSFASEIGLYEVHPDVPARVVINERTGTVVAGENVVIGTTAVAHGNLYLYFLETPTVIQPNPLAGGETTTVPRTQLGSREQRARMNVIPKSTTVAEMARALNALGVTPRDLISIFQALKQAGALHAELVVQ
jgi:flagellar P-ring protein precursor FlgI